MLMGLHLAWAKTGRSTTTEACFHEAQRQKSTLRRLSCALHY
jgi:hypothetical protein